ncbi:uncharacterized protein LOC127862243 isoform X2 [Dreissena polymorpha]|uniref:uncharacterized protein LOC127862243 isoform X2 n=1 Tax=Dreissena polymorpha TaxID=45954 RepID=UPI002264791B|nr:uncharacterized protein LOC127862243 isoform X2 [Dreissena polymorpha]
MSPADPQKPEFQVWIIAAVIQASIAFNNHAVPVPLTTTCTDGNTAITGTFSVNIVDEPPVISALPASGTAINDGLQTTAAILSTFSVTDSDDAVTCSVRVPQNARFEVVAATSPGGRGDSPYVQRDRQRRPCHVLHTSAGNHLFLNGSRN